MLSQDLLCQFVFLAGERFLIARIKNICSHCHSQAFFAFQTDYRFFFPLTACSLCKEQREPSHWKISFVTSSVEASIGTFASSQTRYLQVCPNDVLFHDPPRALANLLCLSSALVELEINGLPLSPADLQILSAVWI